jgi:hypothetical protein
VGKNQVSRKHSGGTHACKIKSGKGVATRGGENAAVEKRNTWQAAGRQQAAGSRQQAGSRQVADEKRNAVVQASPACAQTQPDWADDLGHTGETRVTDTGNRGQATHTHAHTDSRRRPGSETVTHTGRSPTSPLLPS